VKGHEGWHAAEEKGTIERMADDGTVHKIVKDGTDWRTAPYFGVFKTRKEAIESVNRGVESSNEGYVRAAGRDKEQVDADEKLGRNALRHNGALRGLMDRDKSVKDHPEIYKDYKQAEKVSTKLRDASHGEDLDALREEAKELGKKLEEHRSTLLKNKHKESAQYVVKGVDDLPEAIKPKAVKDPKKVVKRILDEEIAQRKEKGQGYEHLESLDIKDKDINETGHVFFGKDTRKGRGYDWVVTEMLSNGKPKLTFHVRKKDAKEHFDDVSAAHAAPHKTKETDELANRLKYYAERAGHGTEQVNFGPQHIDLQEALEDVAESLHTGRKRAYKPYGATGYADYNQRETPHTKEERDQHVTEGKRLEARIKKIAETGESMESEKIKQDLQDIFEAQQKEYPSYGRNTAEDSFGAMYRRGYTYEKGEPTDKHKEHAKNAMETGESSGYRVVPHGHFPARIEHTEAVKKLSESEQRELEKYKEDQSEGTDVDVLISQKKKCDPP
jgi:hypothetical protein